MADERSALLLVRFRRGVVGETSRVCHLVSVSVDEALPEVLTAYCGTRIGPGQAEWLQRVSGMPCALCLVRAPLPGTSEHPDGTVFE